MAGKRITIVSADGHFGLPDPADYREYMEPKYRDALGQLADETAVYRKALENIRPHLPDADLIEEVGQRSPEAIYELYRNLDKRLSILDSQGIAAEVTVAGAEAPTPFYSEANRPYPAELRAAGVRAHHRWVAEMGEQAGPRLILLGESGPCHDMPAAIKELEWLAARGFVSVGLPGLVADPSIPRLDSDYFEPFWSACEDLGIGLHMHAGFGEEQGGFVWQFFEAAASGALKATNVMDSSSTDSPFFIHMHSRQPLWQLMLGGVFDRHPKLQLGMIELRSDWLPVTLAYLDRRLAKDAPHLKLKPSEYFKRNCYVVPSGPHRVEVEQRYQVGVDNFLFGADIPHPEGTWPSTWKWIGAAFAGVPEAEVRQMLGGNAVRIFGLDSTKLDAIAAKIGPTLGDLFGAAPVDPRLLQAFERSGGYLKPAEEVNMSTLEELVAHDLTATRERVPSR